MGPVTSVPLQAAQVVLAPIPGRAAGVVSGYLFGAVLGTVYSGVGAVVGSAVAFWPSRRYGRGYGERVLAPETMARFDAFADRDAAGAPFVAFLAPGLPDDAICFLGGLTRSGCGDWWSSQRSAGRRGSRSRRPPAPGSPPATWQRRSGCSRASSGSR